MARRQAGQRHGTPSYMWNEWKKSSVRLWKLCAFAILSIFLG
jgi:hypothetical protein